MLPRQPIKTYWQTSDKRKVRLYLGDVLNVLRGLPAGSVQMVVTSPPYWGLRDYGTAEWEGGDKGCDHRIGRDTRGGLSSKQSSNPGSFGDEAVKRICPKCGAKRIDQQIGSERTLDEFVAKMVEVFREVFRVLRDDGTLWLNLGDSYSGVGRGPSHNDGRLSGLQEKQSGNLSSITRTPLPSGNLMGMPWRVAIALQADGWILRQDIIWSKPSPMPESVRNRCTKSHEYIFLFAKKQGYFYDADAVREPARDWGVRDRSDGKYTSGDVPIVGGAHSGLMNSNNASTGRNKHSVWVVASESYAGAHFATFPRKLITPCILAGTSAKGACVVCGAPWKRVVKEREGYQEWAKTQRFYGEGGKGSAFREAKTNSKSTPQRFDTIGWEPTCTCNGRFRKRKRVEYGTTVEEQAAKHEGRAFRSARYVGNASKDNSGESVKKTLSEALDTKRRIISWMEYVPRIPLEDHPVVPCVVLDPFIGSGTTCCVCIAEGRDSIGIDLSEVYLGKNAIPRIEGELINRPALAYLTGRKAKRMDTGVDV